MKAARLGKLSEESSPNGQQSMHRWSPSRVSWSSDKCGCEVPRDKTDEAVYAAFRHVTLDGRSAYDGDFQLRKASVYAATAIAKERSKGRNFVLP
mmetsp:Transcript_3614/g.22643  ORF Transcript_3614/g.22643 Transcript_3614/m.22643 type:complete len:95 (-) Transcript_3614:4036-4320(-)